MKAFLILEDGNVFTGTSIGSTREVISEIVFNTSMTGYLEVLTDPSYAGQAVVMTYPLIGNYGITPDIVTMSKSIAAGVPLSAVVGRKEIMDSACVGGIGGTYGGSPLACVAALKVIEKIEKENLCEKSFKLGEYIMGRLNEMKEKYQVIIDEEEE